MDEQMPDTGAQAQPRARYLGMGEFESPDSNTRQLAARQIFLEQVQAVDPEVLRALATDVWPTYGHLAAPAPSPSSASSWEEEVVTAACAFPALHEWATHYHLDAPWIKLCVLKTLHTWGDIRAHEEARCTAHALEWYAHVGWSHEVKMFEIPLSDEELRSILRHTLKRVPPYKPWGETRAEAEARISDAFEKQLQRHHKIVERLIVKRGWKKKPENRELAHFRWFADYQVHTALNYSALARKYGVARQTAFDAIAGEDGIARLIDLAPRESRRGRPRTRV